MRIRFSGTILLMFSCHAFTRRGKWVVGGWRAITASKAPAVVHVQQYTAIPRPYPASDTENSPNFLFSSSWLAFVCYLFPRNFSEEQPYTKHPPMLEPGIFAAGVGMDLARHRIT